MSRPRATRQIWAMPVSLAWLTGVGLVAALLGDGIWDVVSWITLGTPIAVVLWCVGRSESRASSIADSSDIL